LNAVDPDGLDCVYTDDFSKSGEVTVVRGDCKSDTDNGVYINGTIDTSSVTYDPKTNELGYSFSNAEEETGGAGTISLGAPQSNSGQLNPFAQGVFSQINRMPIKKFIGAVYGSSVVIGLTGGAAINLLGDAAIGEGVTALNIPQPIVADATSPALQETLDALYQATDKLYGGTSGAVRYEEATGELMSKAGHAQKAQEMVVRLTRLLKSGNLSPRDQQIARFALRQLADALKMR
jgi:hypothetical protein